jgi:hypothetical protein
VFLNDASMRAVDFTGAQVRGALFNESRMRGVELVDVEISGELQNVVVNGVDIAPLVDRVESFPVKECLRIVLNEEWEHRLYAERDLTALEKGN